MATKQIRPTGDIRISAVQQQRLQQKFDDLCFAIRAGHSEQTIANHKRRLREHMERIGVTEIEIVED